jgi:hypothetical protein
VERGSGQIGGQPGVVGSLVEAAGVEGAGSGLAEDETSAAGRAESVLAKVRRESRSDRDGSDAVLAPGAAERSGCWVVGALYTEDAGDQVDVRPIESEQFASAEAGQHGGRPDRAVGFWRGGEEPCGV